MITVLMPAIYIQTNESLAGGRYKFDFEIVTDGTRKKL